jgi:penicillin-binding protein 1B
MAGLSHWPAACPFETASHLKGYLVPHIIDIPNPATEREPPQQTPPEPPKPDKFEQWQPGPRAQAWIKGIVIAGVAIFLVFIFYYVKLAGLADERLRTGVFAATLNMYAAPRTIAVGDRLSESDTIALLRQSGYTANEGNREGRYEVKPDAVAIFPDPDSDSGQGAVIHFSGNQVTAIVSADGIRTETYQLAPRLITNQSNHNREKRRLVQFSEIPPALVDAVVSVEDKRFFSHGGLDVLRILKAAYIDLREGRKQQGASTLSMQLTRGLWLQPEKKWKRKIAELLLTMHVEHKLTKQQIFTYYANQVYLGRRGTFSVNGFGEAARIYFNKDISQLTVPQAAMLAGLVQRPSYFDPFRYPDRALERRNTVLRLMLDNGRLSESAYNSAVAAPLKLSPGGMEAMDSQYYLDLANDELQSRVGELESESDSVYTTLDEDLQRAAVEAVRIGMENVDAQLRRGKQGGQLPSGQPQVALIALDPHTGEIKALVGGRNYAASQLNHVSAERQPGSSFKPFVYAAALNTALGGGSQVFTPATTVVDQPTTFQFNGQQYRPGNFNQNFMGTVSLRQALAHSLNAATVTVAQAVGYPAVVEIARMAGLNSGIKPTPAVALGSYVCTPLEIAGAYTVFANGGMYVKPTMLATVRSGDGDVLYRHSVESRPVLDPRVNYLMVNMLEEVLRSGTGAAVWSLGFNAPAAGKTGTSRDGWFAGFTSRLLCVVWVGFDDYRELGLEGSKSALPIWAEFMKRALKYNSYRDVREFPVPSGVVSAKLCADSKQLAGPDCPTTYTEFFLDGSQPGTECKLHSATPSDSVTASDSATAPIGHDRW